MQEFLGGWKAAHDEAARWRTSGRHAGRCRGACLRAPTHAVFFVLQQWPSLAPQAHTCGKKALCHTHPFLATASAAGGQCHREGAGSSPQWQSQAAAGEAAGGGPRHNMAAWRHTRQAAPCPWGTPRCSHPPAAAFRHQSGSHPLRQPGDGQPRQLCVWQRPVLYLPGGGAPQCPPQCCCCCCHWVVVPLCGWEAGTGCVASRPPVPVVKSGARA